VIGVSGGTCTFTFIDDMTGCEAASSVQITVEDATPIVLTGPSVVCVGFTSQLQPSTGGIWVSSDPQIASVNNDGIVKGLAAGRVSFSYTESSSGCTSTMVEDSFDIRLCVDPDINVGLIGYPLTGSVRTNDDIPEAAFSDLTEESGSRMINEAKYGTSYQLLSSPAGSNANFSISENGNYNFSTTKAGKYEYNVSVCVSSNSTLCPMTNLSMHIIDPNDPASAMVLNTDFMTVPLYNRAVQDTVRVPWMSNDKCVELSSCQLDRNDMWVDKLTSKGSLMQDNATASEYFFTTGERGGMDTLIYAMCDPNNPNLCHKSRIFIMLSAGNATNSIVAADDFFGGAQGTTISGNLLGNDSDPEKDNFSVLAQGSLSNPITIDQGQYYVNSDGTFEFIPGSSFKGNFSFVYNICDDNSGSQACTKATAYFVILEEQKLKLRAYLEGSLMGNKSALTSTGKPLMRDDLRKSPYTQTNLIPFTDPYKTLPELKKHSNRFGHMGASLLSTKDNIINPSAVFAVEGENAIVDWVFVELRDKDDVGKLLATRSGLLQRDGDIVDIDGVSDLGFPDVSVDSVYVAVKHRNHLGLMSGKVPLGRMVDFTSLSTPVFSFGSTQTGNYSNLSGNTRVKQGYRALWAGDFDGNGKVKFANPNDDQNNLYFAVYAYPGNTAYNINYDFAYGYFQSDFNMDSKSKYDNPNDDKNMLFNQVISYSLNDGFLTNYNFFIEQIPIITIR
jgi:large repetitive protein